MSSKFILNSFTRNSTLISLELGDILIAVRGSVANITVALDFFDRPDPSVFQLLQPITDFIQDCLTDYPHFDFFEVINANLASGLLSNSDLGLSSVLDSLTVTLDVAPTNVIPFPFANTITCTPAGNSNGLVVFKLEDILIPASDSVADVFVSLDYIDGLDLSGFKPLQPIIDFIKYSLADYRNSDLFEVINGNLAFGLLSNSELGLSSVLDSLTITLSIEQGGVIPFPFTNTVTATSKRITQLSALADYLMSDSAEQLVSSSYKNINGKTLKRFW
ncbi:hypothetical protein [Mastigocladopsis repens]|uniref:hypothetical protein n=1 Tax=Mastigocladopsis repens TaxID=221287 RepID=UPI00036640D5|nr:hypothetical protein [Mastigocladopsis repens]